MGSAHATFESGFNMDTFESLKQTLVRKRSDQCLPESAEPLIVPPIEPLPTNHGVLSLIEMLLKNQPLLERLIRVSARQAVIIPQLLLIAFLSFMLYGVMMGLTIGFSGWTPHLNVPRQALAYGVAPIEFNASTDPFAPWRDGTALSLVVAYAVGLIAATGICLPSLYFYGLLSGIKLTMRDVVIHSLKSKATAAIMLMGLLPIYFVVCLTAMVFDLSRGWVVVVQWIGFALPFFGGIAGTQSLYRGFAALTDTLPDRLDADGRYQRSCFLERLVLAWSACYSVISPIMVFTIWERLQP